MSITRKKGTGGRRSAKSVSEDGQFEIERVDPGCSSYRRHFFGQSHCNYVFFTSAVGPVVVSIKQELGEADSKSPWVPHIERVIIRSKDVDVRCAFVVSCTELSVYGHIEDAEKLEEEVVQGTALPDLHGLGGAKVSETVRKLLSDVAPALQIDNFAKIIDPAAPGLLLKFDESELLLSSKVKFGVLFCKHGQTTEKEMYNNERGSPAFEEFLALLGDEVVLKNHKGFMAGLPDSFDGAFKDPTSVYTEWCGMEIMFHVSTLMQFDPTDPQKIQRKRHIGNDIATIVFIDEGDEGGEETQFDPAGFMSHFLHVFIVVRVKGACSPNTRYTVSVHTKPGTIVPAFGPDAGPEFSKGPRFRNFLLTKLLNAQNAALRTPFFQKLSRRTRKQQFKELITGGAFSFKLKFDVHFPESGSTAAIVRPPNGTPIVNIVKALDIPKCKSVIVTIGGAANMGPEVERKLTEFFSGGIAAAASGDSGCVIITGGTKTGVMNLMGEGIQAIKKAGKGKIPLLLGVVANDKIYYPGKDKPGEGDNFAELEPHHSHFVLVDADDWGGETQTMMGIASLLAWSTVPFGEYSKIAPKAITVLSNGGKISLKEAWFSVQAGLPLVVLKGSGRLADEICRHIENKTPVEEIEDSQLRDILRLGKIEIFELGTSYKELKKLLLTQFKDKTRKAKVDDNSAITGIAEQDCNVQ